MIPFFLIMSGKPYKLLSTLEIESMDRRKCDLCGKVCKSELDLNIIAIKEDYRTIQPKLCDECFTELRKEYKLAVIRFSQEGAKANKLVDW